MCTKIMRQPDQLFRLWSIPTRPETGRVTTTHLFLQLKMKSFKIGEEANSGLRSMQLYEPVSKA